jgi:DNA-binding MarR family transcriptional regulator
MVNDMKTTVKLVRQEIDEVTPAAYLKANMLITLVAATFERLTDRRLKRYNINHSGFMILYQILENGSSMNITEITKKLYLTRQAVSLTTRYLEKQELITRNGTKGDRRKIRVEITEKGIDLVRRIGTSEDRRDIHNVLAAIISEDEALKLASTLNLIVTKLHRMKYV